MRILTLANHIGSRGGLERTQLTNCRALAQRGHRVDLLYVSPGDFADDWRQLTGSMVQVSGLLPRRARLVSSVTGVLKALAQGRRLSPDVLYVYRYWDLPYAATLARLSGAGVTFHLCLPPPKRIPRWLDAALARVDTTLSVSEDTARRWVGTSLSSERTSVALTGVDLDHYRPADEPQRSRVRGELGLGPEDLVVIYAGRIGREKGVEVLVRAFRILAGRRPDARLVVVGSPSLGADPADSERYGNELRSLGEGLAVTFLEGRRDIVDLLSSADVAVVPSLWPEPLSRALMEPLACGVPVVASDVGGNPEVLTGWLSELIVPAGDHEVLAQRLDDTCDWRRLHPDLGPRCRAHAEQHLSVPREVGLIEEALQEAVDRSARRSVLSRRASPTEARSCG